MPTATKVKVNEIEAVSHQPRRQVGDVSDLVKDIEQTGRFYSALALERTPQGNLRVISGSRRLKAAQAAGLVTVPAIIYEADEMDAVTRLRMQLGENNTRRDLRPMEQALSYYELKVRMDCMYLSDALKVTMPEADDLAGWEAAYARLVKQAEGQPLERVRETWAEFERYSGLSRDQRVDLMQLLKLSGAVRARLLGEDAGLTMSHHLALAEAPAVRQEELLTAVLNTPGELPPVRAIQAAARVLGIAGNKYVVGKVLVVARRLLADEPNQRVERLKERVLAELAGAGASQASRGEPSSPVATLATPTLVEPPPASRTTAEDGVTIEEAVEVEEAATIDEPADKGEVEPASRATPLIATLVVQPTLVNSASSETAVASLRPELMTPGEQEAEQLQRRGQPVPAREYGAAGREFQQVSRTAVRQLDQHVAAMLAEGEYDDLTGLLRGWSEWVGNKLTKLAYAQQGRENQGQDEQPVATYR